MNKKVEPKLPKDPVTLILVGAEILNWGCVIPGPDQENDTYYGMIVGKNEFIDLIYSYLPPDFDKILKEKIHGKSLEIEEKKVENENNL